jgi:hypothetical protein
MEIDPKLILYSLPTICDMAPATTSEEVRDSPDTIRIHEDDWRQVEFVTDVTLPQIDREMAVLEAFKTANRAGLGWKDLYIRKERPDGLSHSGLPYNLIDSIKHGPVQKLVIGSAGQEAIVKGGFAIVLSQGLFLYGQQSKGAIINIGLSRLPNDNETLQSQQLRALCKKFNLVIVDWCAGQVVDRP